MKNLIKKIKSKKPLNILDNSYVEGFLIEFLKRNFKLKKKFESQELKKKDQELIVKGVRNKLNKVYGQFWLDGKLTLDSHKSTKERKEFYNRLYKRIFSITGKPNRILDLGCGLNPLTYDLIRDDVYFISSELTDHDCDNLRKYFKKNKINGIVIKQDLRGDNKFPEVDVCFMFKILDILDLKGHKIAEHLVSDVKTNYLVASFSTENINGKKMNFPRRGWFEVMLKRLGYSFDKFEEKNEVFYVVKKN